MKVTVTSMSLRGQYGFKRNQPYETVEPPAGTPRTESNRVWLVPPDGDASKPIFLNSHEFEEVEE